MGDFDASNAVVFNLNRDSDGDLQVTEIADLLDKVDGADAGDYGVGTVAWYKADDGEIDYLVVTSSVLSATDVNLAMINSTGRDSDGDYVYILLQDGTTEKYTCDSDDEDFVKNEVFSYELVSGDINNTEFAGYDLQGATVMTIDDINNKVIKLNDGTDAVNYYVDADTLYWDSTDDDPEAMEFSDLSEGDTIKIFRQATSGAIEGIQLVD
jgi:hypothetical protein